MRALIQMLVLCAGVTGVLAPSGAAAQARPAEPFVLIAINDRALPNGVRALVVRTANGAQPDLVVLAPDASAVNTLSSAVALLRSERRVSPAPAQTAVHHLYYTEAPEGLPRLRERMESVLAAVRTGEVRQIEGVGTVRVLSIPLASVK